MQAIVTSTLVLPGDRWVVTTDRDAKVRVSVLLQDQPLKGSHEIQSYCLGHRDFVTCAAALPAAGAAGGSGTLLITGGGDSAVKLWDPESGQLLSSYAAVSPEQLAAAAAAAREEGEASGDEQAVAGEGAGVGEEGGSGAGDSTAVGPSEPAAAAAADQADQQPPTRKPRKAVVPVVTISVAPSNDLVAVVVEGQREVQLLKVDAAARTLGPCVQRLALPLDFLAPSRAAFDAQGRLWLVGGPPALLTQSAHVAVAAPGGAKAGGECLLAGWRGALDYALAGQMGFIGNSSQPRLTHIPTLLSPPLPSSPHPTPCCTAPFAFITDEVLPASARAFLERRNEDEEALAAAAAAAGTTFTLQLRKREYNREEVRCVRWLWGGLCCLGAFALFDSALSVVVLAIKSVDCSASLRPPSNPLFGPLPALLYVPADCAAQGGANRQVGERQAGAHAASGG